jgi:hypothetical protein
LRADPEQQAGVFARAHRPQAPEAIIPMETGPMMHRRSNRTVQIRRPNPVITARRHLFGIPLGRIRRFCAAIRNGAFGAP